MFNNSTGFTMPVVPAGYGYGTGGTGLGGFGDSWIGLIVILALLGGWGNGFGGFGGGWGGKDGGCATQADVRNAVDQQTLISKLDQQTYGMADSFTALNNTLNGNFRGLDNAICTLGYQNQQGFSNLASQMASCCCGIERSIDGVNYNMATQACDTRNLIQNAARDITDNANANTRSILDFIVQDKISMLQAENQNLKLAASQAAQNTYLLNELKPCPQPAYITCNPFTGQYGGYGYNGCGCGC